MRSNIHLPLFLVIFFNIFCDFSDCRVAATSKQCENEEVAAKLFNITTKLLKLENYSPFGDEDPQRSLFED